MSTRKTKRIKPIISADKYTVKQILDIPQSQISRLRKADLYEIAKRGAALANQRRTRALKAIEKNDLAMPIVYGQWTNIDNNARMLKNAPKDAQSYRYIDFNVTKSMKLNELRSQMHYIRNFLKSETSTIEKWKSNLKDMKSRIEVAIQKEQGLENRPRLRYLDKNELYDFWNAYNKIKESDYTGYSSTQVQAMLYQDIKSVKRPTDEYGNIDIDTVVENLKSKLRMGYEQKKQVISDVSDSPFDLGSNE